MALGLVSCNGFGLERLWQGAAVAGDAGAPS